MPGKLQKPSCALFGGAVLGCCVCLAATVRNQERCWCACCRGCTTAEHPMTATNLETAR